MPVEKIPQAKLIPAQNLPSALSFLSKRNQLLIVSLLPLALYANTLSYQFALDDGMVLSDNKFVLKGISAIPDILTHDSFYGSIGDTKNLTGGRYRPLSLVSYAMEISLFGKNPFIHHLMNALLYALTAIVLLQFLSRHIFTWSSLAAFITTLLFVVHPIHTEVVANIKSRDEIFSLLFLVLTLHFLLQHAKDKKPVVIWSLLFYFLALLSKENGLIFVVMIPLTLYFFTNENLRRIFIQSIPFVVIAVAYLLIRFSLIGLRNNEVPEVMDNPYVLATTTEKLATILSVFLKYLQLLFFPHPLTYDYSFRQIPYHTFADVSVWISLLICAGLVVYAFIILKRKDIISWCIFFFFGTLLLVSNLIFNIGAPMAERFLYQASVPFLIAVVELTRRLLLPLPVSIEKTVGIISLLIIIPLAAYATIVRNNVWKNDETLFLHDVKVSSASARANTYAGVALVNLSDEATETTEKNKLALEALGYFRKSLLIKNDYMPTLLNMGVAYSRLDSVDAAEATWNKARSINPNAPLLKHYDEYLFEAYYDRGLKAGIAKNYSAAIHDLEKAAYYNPSNAEAWYNLGGAYYSALEFEKAKSAWEKTLQLNPDHQQAKAGLNALTTKIPE